MFMSRESGQIEMDSFIVAVVVDDVMLCCCGYFLFKTNFGSKQSSRTDAILNVGVRACFHQQIILTGNVLAH